jgi:non-specific serine/threonine protein kinase
VATGQGDLMPMALIGLGRAARLQGDPARAAGLLEEGLARCRAKDFPRGAGAALRELGLVAWQAGDPAAATARLRESLALRRALGDTPGIAECLEGLARVAAGTGQPGRAARLLGAAGALREAIGAPLPPVERPNWEATRAAVNAALGNAAAAAAWKAGAALPWAAAVAEALAEEASAQAIDWSPRRSSPGHAAPTRPAGLTPREVEVLRLVAEGLTDAAIAARLSVGVKTVNTHVARVLAKTGCANRAAATAFAAGHGLL